MEVFSGEVLVGTVAETSGYTLRKIVRWIVYVGVFLIPLFFLPFTADTVEFNKQVLLFVISGVGLVLFLINIIKNGSLRYRFTSFYWPLAGMMLASIIVTAVSVQRYTSLFGVGTNRSFSFLTLTSILILFFLALNVIEDKGKILREILTTSISIALLVGVLNMIGVHIFSGVFSKPNFNTVGSLNSLGFLGAALLPLFMIASQRTSRWQAIIANCVRYLGLLSALVLIAILNWAPLWIAAFITILAYIAFTSNVEVKKGKMKFFALPMAVFVIGIFLWIIDFNWTTVKGKLPVEVAPTHSISYKIAAGALKEKPFGYGSENFVIAYDLLRPKEAVNNMLFQARFTDATSEFATMIVEGGILMSLAFLALIFFFVRNLIKNIRSRFGDDPMRGKLWASTLGLIVVFFLYPMGIVMLFAFFMVLGLCVLVQDENSERVLDLEGRSAYSFVGSLAFIMGLVAVLVGGYFIVNQYIGNVYLAKASTANDKLKSIDFLVKSINSYSNDSRQYQILSQTLIAQVADELKTGPKSGQSAADFNTILQNHIASAVNVAVQATTVNPSDSENWLNRGYIYQNLISLVPGSDEAALNMYQEVIKRSPANALAHARIGNIHLTLADNSARATARQDVFAHLNAAEESYKSAIALYNNYGQALYNLAAVYDRKGELSQAIKQFEKLQSTAPRDPSILFQLGLLYYRNNQKDNALRSWEQSVLSFPNYSNARWYLSLIYEERGDLQKALAQVKEIEKFNPENTLVKDRIAKLQSGIRIIPPSTVLEQKPLNNEQ